MTALQLAADPSAIAPIGAAVLALAAFLLLMFVFLRPDDIDVDTAPEADDSPAEPADDDVADAAAEPAVAPVS